MVPKPLTYIALDWARRCFGDAHINNWPLRSLRIAEEAVELTQAYDIPREKMHALVDMVYSRPKGRADQELGGVLLTATVLAASKGADPEQFFLVELARVLAKPPAEFAKRNQEKIDLGMMAYADPPI